MSKLDLPSNILSLVDFTLSLCFKIYKLAQNVKANKERCRQVAKRVEALEELVLAIKKRGPRRISATVENSLRELCTTLIAAKKLMKKYSQTNAFMSFMKSSSHEDKFCNVDKSLTDTFQVLSGALLIEQSDVLHKVYKTVRASSKTGRPTIPTPVPSTTTAMTLYSPTTATAFPSTTTAMTLYSPTTATPFPSTMPTMTVYSPMTPMPACSIISSSTSSISLPGTMASSPFSTNMASSPFSTSMASSPFSTNMASSPFSTNMASSPAVNIMAPMTFSPHNTTVVTTYGYGSFFS